MVQAVFVSLILFRYCITQSYCDIIDTSERRVFLNPDWLNVS